MSGSVFVSRLRSLPVIDAEGDEVGRVRDIVVQNRPDGRAPRVRGFVVALFARHRIFIPMARVRHVDGIQVTISGTVNTRRFTRRDFETLVFDDLFDAEVRRADHPGHYLVFDIAIREVRSWEWEITECAVKERAKGFGRRGHMVILPWSEIVQPHSTPNQAADQLVAQMEDMHAADVAKQLHDLTAARRAEVVAVLDEEVLADALGELPGDDQIEVLESLDVERAAIVLDAMDPDDAADLVSGLPGDQAEELLGLMNPNEAQDLRRLLTYEESTAGGLMTPEPVIVPTDGTVADALALVRNEELTPALASMVFVCRSPHDTPTGRFLGGVHIQRLLREPPSTLVSALVDTDLEPIAEDTTLHQIARYFAVYNLVTAPVVDPQRRLIGAITVDDVLDHILPEDWRDDELDEIDEEVTDAF